MATSLLWLADVATQSPRGLNSSYSNAIEYIGTVLELIAVLLVRTARLIWRCGVAVHDISMRTPAGRRDHGKYARVAFQ
jgi:hypothetical protein